MKSSAKTGIWSSDPVDHAVGERHLRLDPGGELRVACPGESQHALAQDVAIVAEVVARQHGERPHPARAPVGQRRGDEAEDRAWRLGMGQIVRDVGRLQPEGAGRLVEIVAALGDGQRHDPDRIPTQPAQHGRGIGRREQVVDDRAHDRKLRLARRREQGQGVEAVLLGEACRLGAFGLVVDQADATDAPAGLAGQRQDPVDVDRLMGAVEVADAEVCDAGVDLLPIIGRPPHLVRQLAQGRYP